MHADTNILAHRYTDYLKQAYDRIFKIKRIKQTSKKVNWFDKECRDLRQKAVNAGARAVTNDEKEYLVTCCRQYRACKQRKKRQYIASCFDKIESAYNSNKSTVWKTISSLCPNNISMPHHDDFYIHFKKKFNARL